MKYKIISFLAIALMGFILSCRLDFPRQVAIDLVGETHTANSVSITFTLIDLGGNKSLECGICYSESNTSPEINNSNTQVEEDATGLKTIELTGLQAGKTYHCRAYARADKILYTPVIDVVPGSPMVSTVAVSNITVSSATSGGSAINNNGSTVTSKGICWSRNVNPTITDNIITYGSGNGDFTCMMTNLAPDTKFYVKAFATNSLGTGYGSQISFSTDKIELGKTYQGGVIGYIFKSGDAGYIDGQTHGLIVAVSDLGNNNWGCQGDNMGTSTGFGSGYSNTNTIAYDCSDNTTAAYECYALSLNGYTDWYLPSKEELRVLYLNSGAIGNFSAVKYWTSSEDDGITAYVINFATGIASTELKDYYYFRTKPIRNF